MRCGRVRLTLFFPLHNSNFLYQIKNVVCYPFRTANLVDNGTKEGQIGEGCQAKGPSGGGPSVELAATGHVELSITLELEAMAVLLTMATMATERLTRMA